MSNQPKALELAARLELAHYEDGDIELDAAALLRLQHEVIGELVGALSGCIEHTDHSTLHGRNAYAKALIAEARAKELEGEKE